MTLVRPSLFLGGLAASVAFLAGCTSAGPHADTATAASPNTLGETYHDAELVTHGEKGRQTALGRGESMAPIYGDNTLLVINPIQFEALTPGMTVAFVNSRGQRVVHMLVSKTRAGWMVAGYNNGRIDNELVTPKNLLGVVYATFFPTGDSGASDGEKK